MFTHSSINARRQQRGITLIEVSIGLIIAAIIAAAAFIAFQNNSRRAEIRDNARQITEVISETKQKIGLPNGDYTNLTEDIALQAAILDSAENSYGGEILLAPVGTPPLEARLTWPAVPEDQCIDLLVASAEGVNAFQGVGGADIPVVGGVIPLDVAAEECTPADEGDPITIQLVFGRR